MTKGKTKRSKRHKRKRHSASNFMPAIQPNPTLNNDKIDKLPKIIVDCQTDLDDEDINKIKFRLNFADHNDLRKLNGIRVVDPDTIKMPSKESTTGCYYPSNKYRKAEIRLSSELVKTPNGFEAFLNRIAYKDKLFETLFHELGHHKATLTHSVDKFENEAYAEKYMIAYRKLWKKHYGPSKIYLTLFRILIHFIRIIAIGMIYPFRNKNDELNLIYRNFKGEITFKEYVRQNYKLDGAKINESGKRKKKWTHPLSRDKYRKRFKLPDR
jgi:hypothetical protein